MTSSSSVSSSSSSISTIRFQEMNAQALLTISKRTCVICLLIVDNEALVCTSQKVEHVFHDCCLYKWSVTQKKDSCPVCKTVTKPSLYHEIVRGYINYKSPDEILGLLHEGELSSAQYSHLLSLAASDGQLNVVQKIVSLMKRDSKFYLIENAIKEAREKGHNTIVEYLSRPEFSIPVSKQLENAFLFHSSFQKIIHVLDSPNNNMDSQEYSVYLQVAVQKGYMAMVEAMLFMLSPDERVDQRGFITAVQLGHADIVHAFLQKRTFSSEILEKARRHTTNPDVIRALQSLGRRISKPVVL